MASKKPVPASDQQAAVELQQAQSVQVPPPDPTVYRAVRGSDVPRVQWDPMQANQAFQAAIARRQQQQQNVGQQQQQPATSSVDAPSIERATAQITSALSVDEFARSSEHAPDRDSVQLFRLSIPSRSRPVIHKVWIYACLHALGGGLASAGVLNVVLKLNSVSLAFFYTATRSVTSLIDIVLYPSRAHYADEYGRKPALYVSLSAYLASSVLLSCHASLVTISVAAFIHGVFSIYWTTTKSVLADVLPVRRKVLSQMMAISGVFISICNGLGFAIGTGIIYMGWYAFLPFALRAVMTVGALLAVSTLPETLRKEVRAETPFSRAVPFSWNIVKTIRRYVSVLLLDERIKWLTMCSFVATVGTVGGLGTLAAFVVESFDWDHVDIAICLFVTGFCGGVSSLCTGTLHRLLGSPLLMKLSLSWSAFLMCVQVTKSVLCVQVTRFFYATIILSVPMGWQFFLAKDVYLMSITPSAFQVRIVAAQSIVSNAASLIFSNIYSLIFWYFSSGAAFVYFPGAALLLGGIFSFCALPLLLRAPLSEKGEIIGIQEAQVDER